MSYLQSQYRQCQEKCDSVRKNYRQGMEPDPVDEPEKDSRAQHQVHAQADVFRRTASPDLHELRNVSQRRKYRRDKSYDFSDPHFSL